MSSATILQNLKQAQSHLNAAYALLTDPHGHVHVKQTQDSETISLYEAAMFIGKNEQTIRLWERKGLLVNYNRGSIGVDMKFKKQELTEALNVLWDKAAKSALQEKIAKRKKELKLQ